MTYASGILYISKKCVFLVQRGPQETFPGYWALPAGGTESWESPYEGALRESTEEIGGVFPHEIVGEDVFRARNLSFVTFLANVNQRKRYAFQVELNHENVDWGWFRITGLPTPTHPNVADIIRRLVK
jgi:8-oxo-dGTP pyrophosphatase MutT (NUDIX family)